MAYTIPRLMRTIKLALMRHFRCRFQKITMGNTARKKSDAVFTATNVSTNITREIEGAKKKKNEHDEKYEKFTTAT